jgi:hypothetical protein
MTLHHHRLKKKLVTQTFSCERPLSALFLLTDNPPATVSLLPQKQQLVKNNPITPFREVKRTLQFTTLEGKLAFHFFSYFVPLVAITKFNE